MDDLDGRSHKAASFLGLAQLIAHHAFDAWIDPFVFILCFNFFSLLIHIQMSDLNERRRLDCWPAGRLACKQASLPSALIAKLKSNFAWNKSVAWLNLELNRHYHLWMTFLVFQIDHYSNRRPMILTAKSRQRVRLSRDRRISNNQVWPLSTANGGKQSCDSLKILDSSLSLSRS